MRAVPAEDARLSRTTGAHEPEAYAEYLRCFRDPRRSAPLRRIPRRRLDRPRPRPRRPVAQGDGAAPHSVGGQSGQGSGYDLLKVWRDHATDVRGHGIDSGHFIPEEKPEEVYRDLRAFFAAG